MLEFFSTYPIGHYLKSMGRDPHPPKVGFYISRDATMLMVRSKKGVVYWNGSLKEVTGAPSLEVTEEHHKEKGPELQTPYRREVVSKLKLNNLNECHLILEDPETYTSSYTVTSFENAEDLGAALERDPSSIISSWKNYTQNSEYLWEILAPTMEILRGPVRLPKKVILCGFPVPRAETAAKWAESQGMVMTNMIPATAAILKWAAEKGPQEGFFLLISTTTEIATAYFSKGEMKLYSGQRTKEGFTADEVSDLNELAEESGKGRDSVVWCWGILPGSIHHTRLASRYKNLLSITPEVLRGMAPLTLLDPENRVQEKEAWLLEGVLS
jgi:hypothetical protein